MVENKRKKGLQSIGTKHVHVAVVALSAQRPGLSATNMDSNGSSPFPRETQTFVTRHLYLDSSQLTQRRPSI